MTHRAASMDMELGTLVRDSAPRRITLVFVTVVDAAFSALGTLFAFSLLVRVHASPNQRGEALLFDAAFALPVATLSALLVLHLLKVYRSRVTVYAQGLAVRRLWRHDIMHWEQIASVRYEVHAQANDNLAIQPFFPRDAAEAPAPFDGVATQPVWHYEVQAENGIKLKISNSLAHIDEIAAIIERQTAQVLLPQCRANYEAGIPSVFGIVSVHRQGLALHSRTLPWHELDRMEVCDTVLRVYKRGQAWRWAAIPTVKVSNLLVFQLLLDDIYRSSTAIRQLAESSTTIR